MRACSLYGVVHYFLGYLRLLTYDHEMILLSWCMSVLKVLNMWNEHAAADINDATVAQFVILWDNEMPVQLEQQPEVQQQPIPQVDLEEDQIWLNGRAIDFLVCHTKSGSKSIMQNDRGSTI